MNLDRLQELKQKLTNDTDFSKIWLFYMDHFADHPEFIEVGGRVHNEHLDTVVRTTSQEMFGKKVKINHDLTIYIPEHKFFHGPFQAGGRIGGFIYFEDVKVGLIAVSADHPPTGMVKYSRFTELPLNKIPKRGFSKGFGKQDLN
ncbi:hypothetical protein CAL7716_002310 [Calothrix sp. PCC 7716]|nr:hypothetical protein CAL7716_002310 [Calothrix sp. PCC 7716]